MSNEEEVRLIADFIRRLDAVIDSFERCFLSLVIYDDVLKEVLSEVPEQLDLIQKQFDTIHRLMIALSQPDQPGMKQITAELEQEILRGHIESLKRQLMQQHRNRDILQEESARYGPNVPLHLTNQIIGATVEIDKTASELEHFKGLLE